MRKSCGVVGQRSKARRLIPMGAIAAMAMGLAAVSAAAWAQDGAQPAGQQIAQASDQAAQAPAQGGVSQLQEVVVTAERRAENVQTTPIAVTAVTGEQLRAENITNVNALTQVAPALSVVNQGGYQLVMMRGVGNTLGEDPVTTGVPIILDNMVNPRGTGLNWAWFDIGDVETLRGPQGTLVGANSTGGAILVTSANPNFRGVNGYVEGQVGNYHDNLLEGAVNLPISDTFAMRAAFHTEEENSFYYDQGFTSPQQQLPDSSDSMLDPGNTDERSVRVSMLWKPTDKFQFLFKVQYDQNNTDGIPYNVNPNTFPPLPGLACPYTTLPNGQCESEYAPYYSGNPWHLNYSTFTKYDYWDRFYLGDLRYTFNDGIDFHFFAGSEASLTPEIDAVCACGANDGYSLGGVGMATEPNTNDYLQMELISPSTGKFNWILGSAYVWSDGAFTSYSYTTGPAAPPFGLPTPAYPTIAYIPAGETTRQLGIYGNINWQFTSTLQLTAGLRGNWDNNFGTGTFNIYPAGLWGGVGPTPAPGSCSTSPCIIPNGPVPVYLDNQGVYKQNHQTGKIGLNFTPAPGEFFYVFYARGYKPGLTQFHAFGTLYPNAAAETLDDYEGGWKATLLDNHFTNQLGFYYDKYKGMQQNIFNYNLPQNGGIANVPNATIYGIEESLQAQIGHLGVNLSSAYTHSALSPLQDVPTYEFPAGTAQALGAYLPQCPAGVSGSASCFNYLPYVLNLKGEQDPYAPIWTANATVQYGLVFGDLTVQPRLQYSYTSKQYSNILQNNNYYLMNSRSLWSAYLDFIDGRWDTALYGTNLTNETYMINQTGTEVLYGPPRQFGLKATFTF